MKTSVAEKLANYGAWTYRGAWALEIMAASIGIATALALGYQAFAAAMAANSDVASMDLVLASAPFFMVALAELTKIPVATLLFSVSWLWKPIVLLFLVLLAGITFETVFMGLERAATLRQLQYETLRQQIDALRQESNNLISTNESAANSNFVGDAQSQLNDVLASSAARQAFYSEQIAAVDREIQGQMALSPEAGRARDQLTEAKTERGALVAEQQAAMDSAVQQLERQRDSYLERIRDYTTSGDVAAVRKAQQDLEDLANPRPGLTREHTSALDWTRRRAIHR